jgi:hypothetical protein
MSVRSWSLLVEGHARNERSFSGLDGGNICSRVVNGLDESG